MELWDFESNRYGHEFLHHTYLYHLTRRDIRHNFSPYFYMLYLNDLHTQSLLVKLVEFLPQILLILAASVSLHRKSITFCFFLITFLFVTFNKVCTSQYYVWYLSLLPLVIPRLNMSLFKAGFYFVLWIGGQVCFIIIILISSNNFCYLRESGFIMPKSSSLMETTRSESYG